MTEELIKLLEDQQAFNSAIFDVCEMLLDSSDARVQRAREDYNEVSTRIERLKAKMESGK